MEQFKAAWECGWERKGILMGSFSLGSALAVLLLTAQGAPATLTGSGADVVTAAITAPAVRKSTQAKQVNVRGNKQNKKRQGKKMTVKMAPEPPPRRKETLAEAMDRGWSAGMLVGSGIPITRVFAGSLPTRVQAWAASTFSSATAPFFDGFVLFLVTLLSVASCALGVFRWDRSKSTVSFVRKDLLTLLGLPFAVVLAAVGAADVGSDGS
jgi:hypothetical protein